MLKSAIDRLFHPLTPPQRSSHSIIDRFDTLDVPVSPVLGYSNRVSTPENIHYREHCADRCHFVSLYRIAVFY